MGTDWLGARRTLGAVIVLVLLLASGCAQSGARESTSSPTDESAAVTNAQLAVLRSVPASEPMTGPRVPELFSLDDARKVCGFEDVRITAQTG